MFYWLLLYSTFYLFLIEKSRFCMKTEHIYISVRAPLPSLFNTLWTLRHCCGWRPGAQTHRCTGWTPTRKQRFCHEAYNMCVLARAVTEAFVRHMNEHAKFACGHVRSDRLCEQIQCLVRMSHTGDTTFPASDVQPVAHSRNVDFLVPFDRELPRIPAMTMAICCTFLHHV